MPRIDKFSKIKKLFADEYLRNGNNATQAFLTIKPDTKYQNAMQRGYMWLRSKEVKQYIEDEQRKMLSKNGVDREWITHKLLRMIEDCENDRDRAHLTKALDMLNKMGGNYTTKQEVTHKGLTLNYIKPDDTDGTEED